MNQKIKTILAVLIIMVILGSIYKLYFVLQNKAQNIPAQSAANQTLRTAKSGSLDSSGSGLSGSISLTQAKPVLYLPYSGTSPDRLSPMGETIFHSPPTGHPGIDFIWSNIGGSVTIVASMDAIVIGIVPHQGHAGEIDVDTRSTANNNFGVDYDELNSARSGLKVGDTVHVGDVIGYVSRPQMPQEPNYRMIHWQFGYTDPTGHYNFVNERLCPMTYFSASAAATMKTLWAKSNWRGVIDPSTGKTINLKDNAPNICSNYYAGKDK